MIPRILKANQHELVVEIQLYFNTAMNFARSKDLTVIPITLSLYAQLETNVNIPTPNQRCFIIQPFLKLSHAEIWTTSKSVSFRKITCQWLNSLRYSLKLTQCVQTITMSRMTKESRHLSKTTPSALTRVTPNQICCLRNFKTWCSKWAGNRIQTWLTTCNKCSCKCKASLKELWLLNQTRPYILSPKKSREEAHFKIEDPLPTIRITHSLLITHRTMCHYN